MGFFTIALPTAEARKKIGSEKKRRRAPFGARAAATRAETQRQKTGHRRAFLVLTSARRPGARCRLLGSFWSGGKAGVRFGGGEERVVSRTRLRASKRKKMDATCSWRLAERDQQCTSQRGGAAAPVPSPPPPPAPPAAAAVPPRPVDTPMSLDFPLGPLRPRERSSPPA